MVGYGRSKESPKGGINYQPYFPTYIPEANKNKFDRPFIDSQEKLSQFLWEVSE